jgi:hypothetical protein
MKKNYSIFQLFLAFSIIIFATSCATVFGGSTYNAHVSVKDHPNAVIKHNGIMQGTGSAVIVAKRARANKFIMSVQDGNCPMKTDTFIGRSFRTGAFLASLILATGATSTGIPIPWGIGIDFLTGSVWKPNDREVGVTKTDYRNFNYEIDYSSCPATISTIKLPIIQKSKADRLIELKSLLDKGILTIDEFNSEKKKILVEN